MRSFIETPCGC